MKAFAALAVAVGLAGCVLTLDRERPLLGLDEILAMNEAGVPAQVIAAKISVSRVPGPMTVLEMVRLKEQGVDDRLLQMLVEATADPSANTVYYHAPYGPYPAWVDDPDAVVDYGAPSRHPYWDHRRWVHRERVLEAK